MDVDRRCDQDIDRAEQEAQKGPVRHIPGAMPIGEATEDLHEVLMAAVRSGGTPVMTCYGHGSASPGLVVPGAMPVHVQPERGARWQVAHGTGPQGLVEEAADESLAHLRVVSGGA